MRSATLTHKRCSWASVDGAMLLQYHDLEWGVPVHNDRKHFEVLVLTGAADPFVPKEQVAAFTQEMKAAGAKFQVITYPGAKHGFTNPDAGKAGMDALEYNAEADKKSWAAMLELFREVFH